MTSAYQTSSEDRRDFITRSLASIAGGSALLTRPQFSFGQETVAEQPRQTQSGAQNKTLHSTGEESMQLPPGWVGKEEIVMLMYPGFTALDLFGPHHLFSLMVGAKVHLIAKSLEPVLSDTGIEIKPTMTFADCPERFTVFFVPGGTGGTIDAANDPETREFIRTQGLKSEYVTSVCTGSVLLGAAGLLTGYQATSHWLTRDLLAEFGAIPVDQRVVVDRNRITGAGVTSGLDFGLRLVQDLRTTEFAEAAQLFAEYDPRPPIDKGSQTKASPEISGMLLQMHEPFRQMVRDIRK